MSNKLIDILDDKKKVDKLNEDYHYRQSVLPRLEKLLLHLVGETGNFDFVHDLISDLKETPHHRLAPLEMKECNELWKKYK